MNKLTEEKIFDIIYSKGFDNSQTNQLLKLFSDGYDLTYVDPTIHPDKLRQLRNLLKDCDIETKIIYSHAIQKKQDIISFLGLDFTPQKIFNILLLEEQNLDTFYLKQNGFTDKQFDFLYNAVENELDISWFANPKYSEGKIKTSIKAQKLSIDLSKYLNDYNDEQYEVLYEAYYENKNGKFINISFLENNKLSAEQMKVILEGLKRSLDVSTYADPKYDPKKMSIILKFIENGFNTKWINEKYSLKQLIAYLSLMTIDEKLALKICKDKYNAGQISFIEKAIRTGKNVNEILNPNYSVERMNLILSSDEPIYKDLSFSDEALHLYRFGLIKDINEPFDIKKVSKKVRDDIEICLSKEETYDYFTIPYETREYYINKDSILEIINASEQILEEAFNNLAYRNYFNIHVFGINDAIQILLENNEKALGLLQKLNILKFNDESETFERFDLFSGQIIKTNQIDINKIFTIDIYAKYFEENYYLDSTPESLNNITMFFNYLGIDIEKYYLTNNVYNANNKPCMKLCMSVEEIEKSKTHTLYSPYNYTPKDECIRNLMDETFEFEQIFKENMFVINLYDINGDLLDDSSVIYSNEEIEEMLNNEFQDFYPVNTTSLIECIKMIKGENTLER